MSLLEAIDANLEDLVDPKNRCVEATDQAANQLVIAWTEETPYELQEMMFFESTELECQQFHVDIAKAFAGEMSHDDFFIKYEHFYDIAKREIMDDLDSKIWNRYTDLHDVPALDIYDYNGVKRSDF
tara:strand:- start:361 stop:741 length:381 start_codon:yes stop_codon:yes gene_type:complete